MPRQIKLVTMAQIMSLTNQITFTFRECTINVKRLYIQVKISLIKSDINTNHPTCKGQISKNNDPRPNNVAKPNNHATLG